MTQIEELINEQISTLDLMSRAFINLKKKGAPTLGAIEARQQNLTEKWNSIVQRDKEIQKLKTKDNKDLEYFKGQFIATAEETYLDEYANFIDAANAIKNATSSQTATKLPESSIPGSRSRKLPPVSMPTFSGKYSDWKSFKDLFQAIIAESDLTDVERLYYLKSSLRDEAAKTIKNIPVIEENYKRAWDRLVEHYDNVRSLVNCALSDLFKIPALTRETSMGLRQLREATNEAIESLAALGRPVDHWDDFLVFMTTQRLDPRTNRDWHTDQGGSTEPPTFALMNAFLKTRIEALEFVEEQGNSKRNTTSMSYTKPHHTSNNVSAHTSTTVPAKPSNSCAFCKKSHFINACDSFRMLLPEKRKAFVKERKLCYNCLGPHLLHDCRSTKNCKKCDGRHHTLIHMSTASSLAASLENQQPLPESTLAPQTTSNTQLVSHNTNTSSWHVRLLATARVIVQSDRHRKVEVRALVDPCSEASFISEGLAQRLRVQRHATCIPVSGVGGARCATAKAQASLTISPHFNDSKRWSLRVLILSHLSDYITPQRTSLHNFSFVDDLCLADYRIESNDKINLIIGADLYPKIIQQGLKRDQNSEVIAQDTELGWILTGAVSTQRNNPDTSKAVTSHQISIDCELRDLIQRFWQQEEVTLTQTPLTAEEKECEEHFVSTHRRDSQGRYVLRLPFRSNIRQLGDSTEVARNMLQRMENRFKKEPQFSELYEQFLKEYITLNHMSETTTSRADIITQSFFLPHHGVMKVTGDKAKLRVVFNGSVKLMEGLTLNDCLHVGPKLQNDIFDILLRWRTHRYVFSTDIEKMFRQIRIDEQDHCYQQIYWRPTPNEEIRAYSLRTVTYGLASSPYQAIRTLRQLAHDEQERFPSASEVLKNNSYVDDILAGADTIEEAQKLQHELSSLLMAGGFPLSKWTSNHPSLLVNLLSEQIASPSNLLWEKDEVFSMLGISWQPHEDCFQFSLQESTFTPVPTKRKALSFIGRLYDPLGWISPIIIRFKIFMQHLWLLGLHWDDHLPQELQRRWQTLINDLPQLSILRIPRWIGTSAQSDAIELHGFADASQAAYGAVVYVRTFSNTATTTCIILASKTKVAPLKQVSLPRLELCAAHMLTLLIKRIRSVISTAEVPIHLWSDSNIVLSWIHGHPTQTYVANRVSEIQVTLPNAHWHHISGTNNPADVASRGTSVNTLISSPLWFHGPEFLTSSQDPWPCDINYQIQDVDLEQRPIAINITKVTQETNELLLRYSTLTRLLRVTARCIQFIQRLRSNHPRQHSDLVTKTCMKDDITELTPLQLDSARKLWIKYIQNLHFGEELKTISQDSSLTKRSTLFRLNPFVDNEGLLRVGGRLQHSLLHPDEKHPLILPSESHFSLLLARDAHLKTLHGGTQLTLSHLRRRFWILKGRQLVKTVTFRCLRCWKYKSAPSTQQMGNLPDIRVQQCRPFLHSGIDYAGPINMKMSAHRGNRVYKGYIAIFVCMATRAVHLEAASGYSSNDFLMVYKRFVARRGIVATLSSDCGTNFVGANQELRDLLTKAKDQNKEIAHLLANEGTEWRFNPPSAPHFGGIWEAAVKSTKFHLRRVIGETVLTFEELSTVLAQIEACLNSRPLQPMRDDPTDLAVLTPAHFLIGTPTCTVPEPSTLDISLSRLSRAQLLRNMYEHFWSRWSAEYLKELQQRPKWQTKRSQIKVGQMCVIRSDVAPPCKWCLGRITEALPGKDGLVRVVKVKTSTSTFARPISKISILPFEDYSTTVVEGGGDVRGICTTLSRRPDGRSSR